MNNILCCGIFSQLDCVICWVKSHEFLVVGNVPFNGGQMGSVALG